MTLERERFLNHLASLSRVPDAQGDALDGVWLTYRELADRWSCSVEAVRRRALRGRWQKQLGNDGKERVLVPDGVDIEPRTGRVPDAQGDGRPGEKGADPAHFPAAAMVAALEAHVETLKAQLASAEARADAEAADSAAAIRAFESQLAAERERADRSIRAFESLAQRLEAMAAARRPWWRRLVG